MKHQAMSTKRGSEEMNTSQHCTEKKKKKPQRRLQSLQFGPNGRKMVVNDQKLDSWKREKERRDRQKKLSGLESANLR